MGMDVYGIKPKTQVGEYFRNNVWYWHPLWDYCEFISPEITSKVQNAHSNDGDGLSASQATKLGFALKASIENGTAQNYIDEYYKVLENLPKRSCHCTSNLIFSDSLQSSKSPNPDCNICKGTGESENHAKSYFIDLDNITRFSDFLINCGGFQIC